MFTGNSVKGCLNRKLLFMFTTSERHKSNSVKVPSNSLEQVEQTSLQASVFYYNLFDRQAIFVEMK